MRIALVSTYTHPFAIGLRYVSSYLKNCGHEVRMVFMSSRRDTTKPDYSEAALRDYIDEMRRADLIGLSLMTNNFHRAQVLTQRIREAGIQAPIVWGGTHPTVAPEECLQYADVVCVGEGEEPLARLAECLADATDPTAIPGLWFRGDSPFGNRDPVRNPPAPLKQDLDTLPFPDYELESHLVAGPHGLESAAPGNLRGALDTLRVITTRGCPYQCTFCNNAALKEVHKGLGKWVRMRSLDNVLDELRHARASFPAIRSINFVDDLFFVRSEDEIARFADAYNRDIALPLQLDAYPNTVSEAKVSTLARVPIELISMGIESASENTLRHIYQRQTAPRRIADAIDTFHRHRVRTEYHYIVSNPFEPEENVVETMRFVASHHKGPSVLRVFPLMFYPGTPLYQKARETGLIDTRDAAAYDYMGTGALQFAKHDYLAIWLRFVLNARNVGLPRWLAHRMVDFGTSRPVRFVLDRRWFGPTVYGTYLIGRKLYRNFIHQPFVKPLKYLRSRREKKHAVGRPWRLPRVDVAAMRGVGWREGCGPVVSKSADEIPTAPPAVVEEGKTRAPTNR